eukprot:m.44706 g.44706  ORF g.44706 m.44706 type:complete len:61 (-) comp11727_c0_seq2:1177-1359(-)
MALRLCSCAGFAFVSALAPQRGHSDGHFVVLMFGSSENIIVNAPTLLTVPSLPTYSTNVF